MVNSESDSLHEGRSREMKRLRSIINLSSMGEFMYIMFVLKYNETFRQGINYVLMFY